MRSRRSSERPRRRCAPAVEGLPRVLPPCGLGPPDPPMETCCIVEDSIPSAQGPPGDPPPSAQELAGDPMPWITDPLENPFTDPWLVGPPRPAPPPPEHSLGAVPGEIEEDSWLP
jgi:hypothetical protein